MSSHSPQIHTYHCLCTSLLLASTHTLATLPRRSTTTGAIDQAIILPVPSSPPGTSLSCSPSPDPDPNINEEEEGEQEDGLEASMAARKMMVVNDLPPDGYTLLLSMVCDRKPTIIRREDGFERRQLWRCGRCRLVVGYELQDGSGRINIDGDGKEDKGETGYDGKVVYLLPAGIMSTDVMMKGRQVREGGKRVGEEDVDIRSGAVPAFE